MRTNSLVAVLGIACVPAGLAGQSAAEPQPPIITKYDILSVTGAAVVLAIPELIGINDDSVRCVPCNRSSVPFFDRWIIAPTRPKAGAMSDLLRAGVAGLSWLDLVDEGPVGHAGIVASIESALWAESAVHLIKAIVGRYRPVLYTESGRAVATVTSNQRSWPSGHAATAAALATSYWLTHKKLDRGRGKEWRAWAIIGGAVGVGIMRMAAAKHYPSDVLSGFAAGVATAVLVHAIKF